MAFKSVNKSEACRIARGLNSGNKTAITMVMELAQQLRTEPVFEEGTELNWSPNSFKFNVTLADISAVGTGRSKKEAKHNAANKLLDIILNDENTSPQVGVSPVRLPSPSPATTSSMTDSPVLAGNAVGDLQIMAAKNKWKLPEYEFPVIVGEDHCKRFTCLVKMMSDLQCEGSGQTKKAAKKHAAEKMLKILQGDEVDSSYLQQLNESPSYDQGSSSDSSVLDCSELDDYNSSPRSESPSVHEYDSFYGINPMETLEEKRKVEGFDIKDFKLPNKSKKHLHQVFIILTFKDDSKKAPVVAFGEGETEDIACNKGAYRALKHLEIMKTVTFY